MLTKRWQPALNTPWEPMRELNRLRGEMERLFGQHGVGQGREYSVNVFPALNLWEDDDNLFFEAELPGFELSDLEIYVTGGSQLSLKGERKRPELPEGAWHRQERGFGQFHRVVELPNQVDAEQVSAEFKNGVLMVALPKSEEVKPRRIEVKTD